MPSLSEQFKNGPQEEKEESSLPPGVVVTDTIGTDYLSPSVGQPFVRGQAPAVSAPSGSLSDMFRSGSSPATNLNQFAPVPPSVPDQMQAAFEVISSVVEAEKISPWNASAISNSIRLTVDTPQAAFILKNPNIIDDWQETVWSHTLASLGTSVSEVAQNNINNPNEANATYVRDFFTAWDTTFDTDERKFIQNLIAAMPDAGTILQEANVEIYGSGLWNAFKTGWQVITRAPEAIRPVVNDPRRQMITEMNEYLKANPLKTLEDKAEFNMFFFNRAAESIKDVEANASGFFALAEATVSLPFTVAGNEYNDWLNASADPDSFTSKQNLSIGQTLSIGMGVNPGDDWYTSTSGLLDGVVNIYGDPLNLAFGVGQGIKNAAKVPRVASKADTFADAFKLFGAGRKMNLPVFDRGIVSRFAYAAASKSIDEVVDSRRMGNLWERLAKISSESEIVDLMPAWAQSSKLVENVAWADDPRIIREIVRNGLKHPESMADDAPLLAARVQAELANATKSHKANLDEYIADGGSLQGLMAGLDETQPFVLIGDQLVDDIASGRVAARLSEEGRIEATPGMVESVVESQRGIIEPISEADSRLMDGLQRNVQELSPVKSPKSNKSFRVYRVTDNQGGLDYAVVDEAGESLGGVRVRDGEIEMGLVDEARGVMDQIWNMARVEGDDLLALHGASLRTSPEAVAFAQRFAKSVDTGPVMKLGALTNDGTTKYSITTLGTSGKAPINLNERIEDVATYLADAGYTDDAAMLVVEKGHPSGTPALSRLSPEAQNKLLDFVQASGHDFAALGDEILVAPKGREMLIKGPDIADAPKASDTITESYTQLVAAKTRYWDIHNKMNPRLWVINDPGIQPLTLTKRTRLALASKSNARFMQGLRRQGFKMTNRLPSNISLTETGTGSQQLRDWIKAIGGTSELANKWGDEFRRANPATRKQVIIDALRETGDEIKNPMLRDGIISFGDKQGQYTYFFGRDGAELGLAADGSITPMAMAHFTDNFAMPDAKTLIRSIKRYGNAKRMPGTARGLHLGKRGTHAFHTRKAMVENIRATLARKGVTDVDADDLAAMAYADIFGAEYGRATGFGAVSKAAGVFSSAYSMLHNVFVIGQLAFRPIAWSSRVLIEETVRANLFDLPSIWRNPTRWAQDLADSMAIRKLPQRLAMQGELADELLTDLYKGGSLDLAKAKEMIPNLEDIAAKADVALGDSNRMQALLATYIGKELSGQGTAALQLGSRSNATRRALRNEKKIRNTLGRMDKQGLSEAFRWDIDGQAIAQRSFWQQFVTESEAATLPLEWSVGHMTPKGVLTYGRGYGRQIYQMASDPVISTYGFNRAIARATGEDITYDAQRLVSSKHWGNVRHVAEKKALGDGLTMTDLELADWYLNGYVDEIVSTLFDPLAVQGGKVNLPEKARILREIKNGGTTIVESNGVKHTLNADPSNYEGFVTAMGKFTEGAYAEGRQLPTKMSVYLDPRFGQQVHENGFRRYTDWAMNTFGEQLTQRLHRQPAFTHVHGKYYRYYKDMGWSDEVAREMASNRAAELVNYIYFDNQNIPQFLRDMNKVVPFFSAMWEVGSTWAYKIPSHNVLPVGYLQLGRRVDRTLQGLMASGLVDYDPENNSMFMNVSWDMENADSPLVRGVGRTLYSYMRLPVELLEYLGGLKNLVMDQELEKGDLSAWAKDGYTIGIGNPLDPTSHGLMAVNQFSIGATPLIQYPVSMGANAIFAQSDQRIDVDEGTLLGQFMIDNPDLDMGEILRNNEEAFVAANGEELFNRALAGDIDLAEILVPDTVRIPNTSTWESLVNRLVFPFGRMESAGEIITSVSPSAMNYVWRGMLQKFGGEGADEIAGMLFGQMSGYSMASELITQIQIDEAANGSVTEIMDLASEAWGIVEKNELETKIDEDSAVIVLAADSEDAARAQELFNKIHTLNAQLVKRANDNAAGASIMRGIMGQFGPVTPRMWTEQQKSVANYWAARSFAKEAEATGSQNYSKLLSESSIESFEDMAVLAASTAAWLNDKTGDEAKVWLKQNHPALMPFIQGKSYWGPAGPPPEAQTFDKWIEQMESGDRRPFSPEVWMARYQRTGIAVDKEIAIIDKYGNDPDTAAQAILQNQEEYYNLTEDHNMRYAALEFLDQYLYDGAYDAYRTTELDQLALLELIQERERDTKEELDVLQDMLMYGNLEPDERRRVVGALRGAFREYESAVAALSTFENDDIFQNPREVVLNRWWNVSNQYYEARNEVWDLMETAQDKTDRSILFERLRNLDDEWYLDRDRWAVEGWSGDRLAMPSAQERTWNARSQQEKQERILNMIGKKPEWLSQFEVEVLAAESPVFAEVLPMSPEARDIYRQASEEKWEIRRAWQADPEAFTKSERDRLIGEVDDAVDEWLIANGRGNEVAFREMVPIMRLHETGVLPESLAGIIPVVSGVLEELRANEKSPRTNMGYEMMMKVKAWMEQDYFRRNPSAREAFFNLGSGMFGEPVPSAVYAKLLQNDFFGELG